MTRRRKVGIAKAAVLLGVVPVLLWAYEYGPDPGYVGVPGENGGTTCAQSGCHIGTANDPKNSGSVAVTFPSGNTYTPGVKQRLTVTISDTASTQKAWGFQLTARQTSPVSTMAGTFAPTDADTQIMCSQPNLLVFRAITSGTCPSGYTLAYIEHSLQGFNDSVTAGHGSGSYSYSFDWTPPAANVGNLTIYVAGNAGHGLPLGSGSSNGDHIYTKTYTLTPAAAAGTPSISAGGIVSAGAFGGFTAATAGSWIEIYGTNLSTTTRGWAGSDFSGNNAPTTLDDVKVTVNGTPGYIDYISPTQVNVQVPAGVGTGSVPVVLTNSGGASNSYSLTMNATEPGFLAPPGGAFVIANKQYVVAQHQNGTYVAPTTATSLGTPAKPGETLTIYGVGFGPAKDSSGNTIPFGQIVTASNQLSTPLTVSIGGATAQTPYYGLAPSFVGLYQFNVTIPASAPNNDALPFTFDLGGNKGSQTLYIAVHN
jgi:uncharacterized protein (TIGR03437 family)